MLAVNDLVGFCVSDPAAVHREPRSVHEEEEGGLHRSAADEGSGQRGEGPQEGWCGKIQILIYKFLKGKEMCDSRFFF